jgi:hypothetical protein
VSTGTRGPFLDGPFTNKFGGHHAWTVSNLVRAAPRGATSAYAASRRVDQLGDPGGAARVVQLVVKAALAGTHFSKRGLDVDLRRRYQHGFSKEMRRAPRSHSENPVVAQTVVVHVGAQAACQSAGAFWFVGFPIDGPARGGSGGLVWAAPDDRVNVGRLDSMALIKT